MKPWPSRHKPKTKSRTKVRSWKLSSPNARRRKNGCWPASMNCAGLMRRLTAASGGARWRASKGSGCSTRHKRRRRIGTLIAGGSSRRRRNAAKVKSCSPIWNSASTKIREGSPVCSKNKHKHAPNWRLLKRGTRGRPPRPLGLGSASKSRTSGCSPSRRRCEESEQERVRLLEENVELESRIEQQCDRRVEAEQEASEISRDLAELRGRVETSEEQIGVERSSLDQIRDHRSAIDVRLAEIRSEVKHLEEECRREIGKPIREVSEGESAELTDEELAAAEARHQETKAKLESLGPVNVLALEEFQEAKERLDFLETQKKDLVDSIADTQTAIAEIDAVSRRKFQDAFEVINKNFHEVFRTLFGGGQAEMKLTDEANAADSGIDIIASPPGKRLQNVALLSGGEKSLTAVALLMATFQYKPSPFCVLDEVDAALDEPNLARFSRLVSEMSGRTQFILITHSKTTMETAQTLYGVTMQQAGVSQLVSVRMADQQNGRAAPSREVEG